MEQKVMLSLVNTAPGQRTFPKDSVHEVKWGYVSKLFLGLLGFLWRPTHGGRTYLDD